MMACMILKMGQLFKEYYYIPKWKMLLTPNISTTENFCITKEIYSIFGIYLCVSYILFLCYFFFR